MNKGQTRSLGPEQESSPLEEIFEVLLKASDSPQPKRVSLEEPVQQKVSPSVPVPRRG